MLRLIIVPCLVLLNLVACIAPKPQVLPEGLVVIEKTSGLPITGSVYGQGETAAILASQAGARGYAFNAAEPKKLILVPGTSFAGPSILEINQAIKKQVLAFIKRCNGL